MSFVVDASELYQVFLDLLKGRGL